MNFEPVPYSYVESMVYGPHWERISIESESNLPTGSDCLYVVPGAQQETFRRLADWIPASRLYRLLPDDGGKILHFVQSAGVERIVFVSRTPWRDGIEDDSILGFFRMIKAFSKTGHLRLDVVTVNSISSPAAAVTHPADAVYMGLVQTLAHEFTAWEVTCTSLTTFNRVQLASALNSRFSLNGGAPVAISESSCWRRRMVPIYLEEEADSQGFREKGRYLIIGANGGIGGILARYLARRYKANLVLAGRRAEAQSLIGDIEVLGGHAVYEQLNLSDPVATQAVFDRHPGINGVVHSALVLDDVSVINMGEASLMSVLGPKAHGTVNLANAIRGREMDFVLLFSSIQSYISNPGQANYTAACVCKDAVGGLLRDTLMMNAKIINWGFWGNIGIVASEIYRERMKKLEIGSIEAEEGLAIIERLLRSSAAQITVIKASERALKRLQIETGGRFAEEGTSSQGHIQGHVEDTRAGISASEGEFSSSCELPHSEVLRAIIPALDTASAEVRRNIAASSALQRYAQMRLAHTVMPNRVVGKFARLVKALANIPSSAGPSRTELLEEFPEMVAHVALLDKCMDHYPDMLSGAIDPLAVMFPEGSFALVERIYRDNPLADYFNKVIAQVVHNFISHSGRSPVRVLEIGAGTGSTTQFVLPVLKDRDVTYTFTDVSHAFLNKARHRFLNYAFVRYEIYDVEKPGRSNQAYDVVIATNVIHATGNLEVTLNNVRRLLAPSGIFVLNEITARQDFATLTFGLTDGWWLNNDGYRIADSPLVSSSNWRSLLLRAGFAATECHGTEDQQVIVAIAELLSPAIKGSVLPTDEDPLDTKWEADIWPHKTNVPSSPLLDKVQAYICRVIAEVMLINAMEIDVNQPFRDYGIDSLIALELLKPFHKDLGSLPATILFEHPTVTQLARHFLNEFGAVLPHVLGESSPSLSEAPPLPVPAVTATRSVLMARDFLRGVIAQTMMMDVQQIEDEIPFKEYGIDSLISLEILKPLRSAFGSLPATLLFEYPSVAKLSAYFAEHHQQAVRALASSPNGCAAREVIDRPVSGDMTAAPRMRISEIAARNEDIAIVGISGQFPQADTVYEFWRNLSEGRDCTSEIPTRRWPLQHSYHFGNPSTGTASYANRGGFIRDIDAFDHEFFGITPLESQRMDPQERLFLQNVYHGILDAGYSKAALQGQEVGVFVGVMNGAYAWHQPRNKEDGSPTSLFWSIANRASYVFDWKGPSLAIDTACSSSLTALHFACHSLRAGDCKTAVVGGVNLIVHPRQYELLCNMHMLSKSECCRPFGENADGFVDGEGICCIVIKPSSDALRDGDRIYGIVRGTAVNAGGQSNGYSSPNPDAQYKLIDRAIKRAGIEARNISYVEAHGTGTELGDPIEIRGLSSAFASAPQGSVAIGSVKGNIGHLESAAGLAGVIKVLLQMQAGALVPSIHASRENPHLNLSQTPFRIQKTFQPLDARGPIFASVSSFGAGGANAHVIIQSSGNEAPMRSAHERLAHVAVLSSRTQRGLQREIDHLRRWLAVHDPDPAALSYTLCCARDHFGCRTGYVFETKDELLRLLRSDLQDFDRAGVTAPEETALTAALTAGNRLNRRQAQMLVGAFVTGQDIPWNRCLNHREIVSLPGYSFEKKRFWVDSEESCFHEPNEIVRQHVILGVEIAPAAWTLSRCLEETGAIVLKNVVWSSVIRDTRNAAFHAAGGRFFLKSRDETIAYCEGTIAGLDAQSNQPEIDHAPDSALLVEQQEIYRRFNERGYCYGNDMQVLRWAKLQNSQVKGSVDPQHDWGFRVSPGLIEGGLQAAILMPELQNFAGEGEILVPYHLGELSVKRFSRNDAIYCQCTLKKASSLERMVVLDIHFSNERREVLLSLKDMVSVVAGIGVLQNRRTGPTSRLVEDYARSAERVAVYEID